MLQALPESRICTKCGKDQPVGEFYLKGDGRLESRCKTCKSEYSKSRRHDPLLGKAIRDREAELRVLTKAGETSEDRERQRSAWRDEAKSRYARTRAEVKRRSRLKRYGLSPEAYEAILQFQGGRCAGCGKTLRDLQGDSKVPVALTVDHDHVNGVVRGLLCSKCNVALGMVGDDPLILGSLVEYLFSPPALRERK